MPEHDNEYFEFLEAESEALNDAADPFFDRYGYYHKCRCARDFAEGRTMYVPACWVEMMDIAFDRLAQNRAFLVAFLDEHVLDEDFPADEITEFLNVGRDA